HEGAVDLQVVHRQVLQVRERADAGAEVIQGELATHAMQHADEAPCMIQVGDHRTLADLEADLRGSDPRAVETLDDELQELQIPERLPGDVDGHPAVGRNLDGAAPQRRERRLHDPAIHQSHEPVALGGPHELRRRHLVPRLILQAHQHLHGRPAAAVAIGGHDRLVVELEAVLLQGPLQALQPLNPPRVARQRLIPRGVDRDPTRALLLRDVACGVGGRQQFLERAALARDLDQADGDSDVEYLVLPDEAIVADGATDIVGDLPRLLQGAADEQHAELIAAQAGDRIAVAHRVPQDLGDLAQHAVAGEMAARVVDDLETIEVEITQHVLAFAAMPALGRLLQAPLELAAVDEAGERIVRG